MKTTVSILYIVYAVCLMVILCKRNQYFLPPKRQQQTQVLRQKTLLSSILSSHHFTPSVSLVDKKQKRSLTVNVLLRLLSLNSAPVK